MLKNDPLPNFSLTDGSFVQVGTDSKGNPLFQSIQALSFPTAALADEQALGRPLRPGTRRSNVAGIAIQVSAATLGKN